VARKLSLSNEEVEAARAEAIKRAEDRRLAGLAVVDAIRYMLGDRVPGDGAKLAIMAGTLMLPRRLREEALAPVGVGAPLTFARPHAALSSEARVTVLAIAWAAALHEDPTFARRALLKTRFERVASDLGEDGTRARAGLEDWMGEVLGGAAANMR